MDKSTLKESVIRILDDLPLEEGVEVLDFAKFVRSRLGTRSRKAFKPTVKAVSAGRLKPLTGIVAWGGDAAVDTERLYDDA